MADRTHSHDTPTPAMSDETVPSEEFVLVPREPTDWMLGCGATVSGSLSRGVALAVYRTMISAAPTLSASHLAKEGGEAEVVDWLWWGRDEADKEHVSFGRWQKHPCQHRYKLAAIQPTEHDHPQHSPALAKGGDAVREALVEPLKWARTTDPSEGSVHYGTGVFGHWYAASRVKPKVWSVNHHIDGENVIVGLFESLQSAYAAAQSDYDCRIRAALSTPTEGPADEERFDYLSDAQARELFGTEDDDELPDGRVRVCAGEWVRIPGGYYFDGSTGLLHPETASEACDGCAVTMAPTEGPASQTEGMGGDAEARRKRASELMAPLMELSEDELILLRHSLPVETLARLRAALTPPETAEVVPDACHADDLAVDSFAVAMKAKLADARAKGKGGWKDETECSRQYLSDELRRHALKPDPLDVANFAMFLHQRGETIAPATDDRERLVEALKSAAVSLEQAAGRFNLMGGVGLVNGADPKAGYAEAYEASCVARAALATEASK